MENENDVVQESSPEEGAEVISEDVKTPADSAPKTEEKVVPYDRFKKVNDELARLKKQPVVKEVVKEINKSLDIEDYIDISASLEGLDQREKEYLAREHKLTGKPLNEIRKDENFTLWQSAYRAKVEKEQLSLKPSGTQSDADKPLTLAQRLARASVAEKEAILTEAGLYKAPRPKTDRTSIRK